MELCFLGLSSDISSEKCMDLKAGKSWFSIKFRLTSNRMKYHGDHRSESDKKRLSDREDCRYHDRLEIP